MLKRNLLLAAGTVLAISGVGLFGPAVPGGTAVAQGTIIYPWCANYGGRRDGGPPSCGSSTYAQCMATVAGTQGYCAINPAYDGPPPPNERPIVKPLRVR